MAGVDAAQLSVWLTQAKELHREGRLGQAAQLFARVLDAQPDHDEALSHSAAIAPADMGPPAEVVAGCDRVIALKPDFAAATRRCNSGGNALLWRHVL